MSRNLINSKKSGEDDIPPLERPDFSVLAPSGNCPEPTSAEIPRSRKRRAMVLEDKTKNNLSIRSKRQTPDLKHIPGSASEIKPTLPLLLGLNNQFVILPPFCSITTTTYFSYHLLLLSGTHLITSSQLRQPQPMLLVPITPITWIALHQCSSTLFGGAVTSSSSTASVGAGNLSTLRPHV